MLPLQKKLNLFAPVTPFLYMIPFTTDGRIAPWVRLPSQWIGATRQRTKHYTDGCVDCFVINILKTKVYLTVKQNGATEILAILALWNYQYRLLSLQWNVVCCCCYVMKLYSNLYAADIRCFGRIAISVLFCSFHAVFTGFYAVITRFLRVFLRWLLGLHQITQISIPL